jgi:hypothetical protein
MCESKLGKLMQAFRADRPNEWQMDEFIQMAEQMCKDAERYQWLRDRSCHNERLTIAGADPSVWDAIIDEYVCEEKNT